MRFIVEFGSQVTCLLSLLVELKRQG